MYAKIKDGEVKEIGDLPTTGELPDGRQVSGLNLLPEETLKELGWVPINTTPEPTYDSETERLSPGDWEIAPDQSSVTQTWSVDPIPAEELAEQQTRRLHQQDATKAFDRIAEMPNIRAKLKAVASGSDTLTAAQTQRLIAACALVLLRERDDI